MSKRGIEAGRAYVKAWFDDSLVSRGLKAMRAKFVAAGAGLARVGGGLLGAGVGISALFVKPIQAAGKMQAAMASFDTIFKGSAKEMGAWGDELAKTLGRSRTQVREFMTMTQGRLLAAGMDPGAANDLNKQLTTRAFDLAQFWDKDDETAVQAMQNALTGEMEMLKQFGIVISAADTDAKLKAMGLDPRTASQAEKVQARFELMMERSKEVQGTAARESGEWSSLLKRASATVQELAENIGSALLPAILPVLSAFSRGVGWLSEFIKNNAHLVKWVAAGALGLVGLGAALVATAAGFSIAGAVIGGFVAIFGAVASVVGFLLTPFGAVVALLAAGAAAGAYFAYQSGLLSEALAWLSETFGPLAERAKAAFQVMKAALAAGEMAAAAKVLWAALKAAWAAGIAWLMRQWERFRTGTVSVFRSIVTSIRGAWSGMVGWLAKLLLEAVAGWRIMFETLSTGIVNALRAAAEGVMRAVAWALEKGGFDDMAKAVREGADGLAKDSTDASKASQERIDKIAEGLNEATTAIDADTKKKQDAIAAEQAKADAASDAASQKRLQAYTDGVAEADAEFKSALFEASKATVEANRAAEEAKAKAEADAKAAGSPASSAAAKAAKEAKPAINSALRVGTTEGADALVKAFGGKLGGVTKGERLIAAAVDRLNAAEARRHREAMKNTGGTLKVEKAT